MKIEPGLQLPAASAGKATVIRFTFPAEPGMVRGALKTARQFLLAQDIPHDQRERAELALAEALNNIAEHAYLGLPPGMADLQIDLDGGAIGITVRDRGVPPPPGLLRKRSMPSADGPRNDLPEGGFGWPLLARLTTDLRQVRRAGENCLSFTIPQAFSGG